MKRIFLKLFKWMGLLLIVAALVLGYQVRQFLIEPISTQTQPAVVEIQPGASAASVASQLHQAGLLNSPKWYVWYLRYFDRHGLIKTGEMMIEPSWTVQELTEALIKGETVKYPVTLIAGHTFKETLQQVQALPKIDKQLSTERLSELYEVFALSNANSSAYPFAGLEGQFLPETYFYQAGDSDKDILLRAQTDLQAVLQQAWQNRQQGLPFKSPYEALIMASLVEKETAVAQERTLIAGVFINRLNKRMRLQTDPTVIYGIGPSYDGNIRKRDLLTTTPYNTYRINGLPPTPIALPSREAIEAVMHPDQTKALYFVSKGNGEHYFSETLNEHNRAVRKYQLLK
ncbi:endolytic transglycosylase MltG [Thiomicrorhabdus chilensis]|uniref:endolytic transglycosylase MltG n=1 Tax=Thiomicrorhabdus chilensis TaxID=63656 RepID=UPI000417A61E|nr:endolytic transglycosylase MltG [Thiomicrorhabdus chilensis]